MNNKQLGNEFEQEFCEMLKERGYWVHFITPDKRGAQPFDVIAVMNGYAHAFDCKTSSKKWFSISRLEENQKMAFNKWIDCGNNSACIAIKYDDHVYCIPYVNLLVFEKVNLENCEIYRWK